MERIQLSFESSLKVDLPKNPLEGSRYVLLLIGNAWLVVDGSGEPGGDTGQDEGSKMGGDGGAVKRGGEAGSDMGREGGSETGGEGSGDTGREGGSELGQEAGTDSSSVRFISTSGL